MFVLLSQHFCHHKGGSSQWHFPVQAALLKTQVGSKSSKAFPCIWGSIPEVGISERPSENELKISFFTPVLETSSSLHPQPCSQQRCSALLQTSFQSSDPDCPLGGSILPADVCICHFLQKPSRTQWMQSSIQPSTLAEPQGLLLLTPTLSRLCAPAKAAEVSLLHSTTPGIRYEPQESWSAMEAPKDQQFSP